MHPRLLAIDYGCSGGTCPAVYDSDPDLAPGELAVVGTKAGPGLSGRLSDRVAGHEAAVVIKRETVAEALRPAPGPVTPEELQAQFETFSYSAFRLETLQHYAGTARDEQWITLLRASCRWGKTHQRVHVVREPLTAAMQQELTEGYEGNVAAGEDIRIIPVGPGAWPDSLPRADFWLFDSSLLYAMDYEPDGTWAGARRLTGWEQVACACRWRDAALHLSSPWSGYIASRPDLRRRLAQ